MAAQESQAKPALARAQFDQTAVTRARLGLPSPIDPTLPQGGVHLGEFVSAGTEAPSVRA